MKRLSFWFLIVTLTLQVQAGVPEPKGVWEFNSPNPNSATVGAPLEIVGSAQDIAGVSAEDGAMTIGEGSYYICRHDIVPNGNGAKVNEWTLLIDFSYPSSSLSDPPNGYNDLFQTDPTNTDDSDWTINSSGAIGIGAVGYSNAFNYTTQANTWYRMVVVVDNGVRHDLYVDGAEIFRETSRESTVVSVLPIRFCSLPPATTRTATTPQSMYRPSPFGISPSVPMKYRPWEKQVKVSSRTSLPQSSMPVSIRLSNWMIPPRPWSVSKALLPMMKT